jgi:Skp family chaperone for outer membrane proteins
MSDRQREPDWSAWNRWCDARIDARRSFDREVLIELVADLKGMIEDQDEKLKAQTENIHNLELKLADLRAANDRWSAEDDHTSVKLAEHQIAIAELRCLVSAERAKVIDQPDALQRRGLN